MTARPLYKHTIVIWAREDFLRNGPEVPSGWDGDPAVRVAAASYDGDALCAQFTSERVEDPGADPSFPSTDFFDTPVTLEPRS